MVTTNVACIGHTDHKAFMTRSPRHRSLLVAPWLLALAACSGEVHDDDDDDASGSASGSAGSGCSTNQHSYADEGPLMEPGGDCVGCHTQQGEGPRFAIAGTVMGALDDEQTCSGIDGYAVVITAADGQELRLATNADGNFSYEGVVALPYQAKVVDQAGNERAMGAAQTEGSCGACHTPQGTSGAPGRILPP